MAAFSMAIPLSPWASPRTTCSVCWQENWAAVAAVSCPPSPRGSRRLTGRSGGLRWSSPLPGQQGGSGARPPWRSRRACVVAGVPQRSRFFKTYTRSAQHKIQELVKRLCTGQESAAATLDQHGSWLTPLDSFNVLDGIGRQREWLLALEVFRWVQNQKWYTLDSGYYSKLIAIMAKEKQTRMAMEVFREMKKIGCRPDTSTYNSVMTVHLQNAEKEEGFARACNLLDEMKLIRRALPNVVSYNILVRAAAQLGKQGEIKALLKDMFRRDLSPDNYTFNGIMDAYGKAGDIANMEVTFKQMRDEKLKPDVVTFNTLIDAYGKAREFEKMERVFWSMPLKRTPPVPPTVKTFNSMIANYGNVGAVEKVDTIFQEMKQMGVPPSFVTYDSLVMAYGQAGQFHKVKHCLHMMKRDGFHPQSSTLNNMLKAYCCRGMTAEAETLLTNSVRECGVGATSLSYATVIHWHCQAGNQPEVMKLLDRMKAVGLKPTKATYMDVMELVGMEVDRSTDRSEPYSGTRAEWDELSPLKDVNDTNQEELFRIADLAEAAT